MDVEEAFVVPEWLQQHPKLQSRDIVLEDPLKPVRYDSVLLPYSVDSSLISSPRP